MDFSWWEKHLIYMAGIYEWLQFDADPKRNLPLADTNYLYASIWVQVLSVLKCTFGHRGGKLAGIFVSSVAYACFQINPTQNDQLPALETSDSKHSSRTLISVDIPAGGQTSWLWQCIQLLWLLGGGTAQRLNDKFYGKATTLSGNISAFFFYCNCDQKQINNGKKLLPTIHQVSANFLSAGPRISQQLNESLFGLSSASQSVRIMSDAQHMVGTGGTGVNASDLLSAIFTKQSPLQPTGQCTFPLDLVHDNKAAS